MVALAVAGFALAAAQGDSYAVTASLKARAEVPKPKGVPAGATGSFTGTESSSRTTRRGSRGSSRSRTSPDRRLQRTSTSASPERPARWRSPSAVRAGAVRRARDAHARPVREARVRRGVREHPHGEERRRRDSRSGQGLGRLAVVTGRLRSPVRGGAGRRRPSSKRTARPPMSSLSNVCSTR